MKKEKGLEEKIAYREHIVTDMGNGSSYCSNCHYNFGPEASKHYESCPGCGYRIKEGSTYINWGGSDF